MNNMFRFATAFILCGMSVSPAFADSGTKGDCYFILFLVFGAFIVIAQLVPAVLIIIGFIKGFPMRPPEKVTNVKTKPPGT